MHSEEKLYQTLSLGIYHRFKKEEVINNKGINVEIETNKAENPYDFEVFVANIMETILGGRAKVTPSSGDFGVDMVHTLKNRDIYLGQVKCYAPNNKVIYEPISILHSNIVKSNAQGGYFITTSDYNNNAKKYAEDLNIKLINGYEFAQYWMGTKESWIDEPQFISFTQHILNGLDWIHAELSELLQKRKIG